MEHVWTYLQIDFFQDLTRHSLTTKSSLWDNYWRQQDLILKMMKLLVGFQIYSSSCTVIIEVAGCPQTNRMVFAVDADRRPQWRALYKPPLIKGTGDLQWRILHGAIAVNSFISVLNPEIGAKCPFCNGRENIFHAFVNCARLELLFLLLGNIFASFSETFSLEVFILGFKYARKRRFSCQLLNFVIGQAKLAVYMSRKKKIEHNLEQDAIVVFSNMMQARILIDFKHMNDLDTFENIWCCNGALCCLLKLSLSLSLSLYNWNNGNCSNYTLIFTLL